MFNNLYKTPVTSRGESPLTAAARLTSRGSMFASMDPRSCGVSMSKHRAYIGLGSNLSQPRRRIEDAVDEIAALPGLRLAACSSLYRSAPVGFADQPDFINAVAAVDCDSAAMELLSALQLIEHRHGRLRSQPNGPRTLDLDLLMFDDLKLETTKLTLPHPRAHLRAFVLLPLLEIAPECVIPGRGKAADWMPLCRDQAISCIDAAPARPLARYSARPSHSPRT
jgi:2-amino-4-hydroxy-6-hydroxymethyldihydropteridine diphosphokinase